MAAESLTEAAQIGPRHVLGDGSSERARELSKQTYEIFLGSKAAVGGLAHDGVGNSVETRADLVDTVASLPPPARIPVIGCASGREGSTWADGVLNGDG